MEQPIIDVKVDIPLADVKSELGAEFILRKSPLIAFGTGRPEQIDQEIIRSLHLYAEHKDQVDKIITSGDYHLIPMGGPPNHQCKIMLRNDGIARTPVNGFQYI
jgi:hypothetical protein